MCLTAGWRGDRALGGRVSTSALRSHQADCSQLTSSRRGKARYIRRIGVVASEGPVWVIVLVVPHGAENCTGSEARAEAAAKVAGEGESEGAGLRVRKRYM